MTGPFDDPEIRPAPLEQLRAEDVLDTRLEDRVVASLQARGALGAPRRVTRRRLVTSLSLLAASVAGFLVGRRRQGGEPAPGPKWVMLLYEDAGFEGPAPGREADYVEEYRAWSAGVAARGELAGGAELGPGTVIDPGSGWQGDPELTGPGGRLSGYFVLVAETRARADEIARTCPHFRHRGRIVLRPVTAE